MRYLVHAPRTSPVARLLQDPPRFAAVCADAGGRAGPRVLAWPVQDVCVAFDAPDARTAARIAATVNAGQTFL